jgi:hypothetical protein
MGPRELELDDIKLYELESDVSKLWMTDGKKLDE